MQIIIVKKCKLLLHEFLEISFYLFLRFLTVAILTRKNVLSVQCSLWNKFITSWTNVFNNFLSVHDMINVIVAAWLVWKKRTILTHKQGANLMF